MISLVCPVFNEAPAIEGFLAALSAVLKNLDDKSEIIFVNDGSKDATLERILILREQYPETLIRVIDLSRNFGKEAALSAGIDQALGAAVIPIDVDLQDPPELIVEMLEKWKQGFDVVLAKRIDRWADTISKRTAAGWFYKLHNKISNTKIPDNVGDYRLMDRRVIDALKDLPERQRFMKGLFAWVGFNATEVEFVRPERSTGKTRFSGWRLWNFAIEGITGFSTVPLRIWTYIGMVISLLSFLYGSFIIIRTLILGIDVPGYASLLTVVLFLGGVQLTGLGVLGEYIGRIYLETKSRPLYIIKDEYN